MAEYEGSLKNSPEEPKVESAPSLGRGSALEQRPSSADIDFLYEELLHRALEDKGIYDRFWSNLDLRQCISGIIRSDEYAGRNVFNHVRLDKTIFFQTKFGFSMPISFTEPLTMHAYMLNDYEEAESNFVFSSLAEGDVAIDLGARHGWFTGIMAAAVGPSGRVYSFEPMPPRAGVNDLIAINKLENIVPFEFGVSDAPGTQRFDTQTLTMCNSGAREIRLTTLDTIFSKVGDNINLIKADIEGAEALAFKGGKDLLQRCHPIIVFEVFEEKLRDVSSCTARELLDWLRSCGYKRFSTLDGMDAGNCDFNCSLSNLVARL